ncbi:MAG: hypothetical protein O2856_17200, partial [Planctomycetota bacterium]|nr:hypothetical protein [Planctomycetota bacterium]
WIEIDEQPGEQILGGLIPEDRRIVLNSRHLDLFQSKPGLERSTIGHEAGHWDIDIDRTSLHHPRLPGFDLQPSVVRRHAMDRNVLVKVLNRAAYDERYFELYRELTAGQDSPEVGSAVDRYQSSMLMPEWLIKTAVKDIDVTSWPALYEIATLAQVTISNLIVRLHRLDIIYIPEGTRDLFAGRDAFTGQKHLPARSICFNVSAPRLKCCEESVSSFFLRPHIDSCCQYANSDGVELCWYCHERLKNRF